MSRRVQATIVAVQLSAAHDGHADLTVVIEYPNGSQRSVNVVPEVAGDVARRHNLTSLSELLGQPWTVLVE